MSFKIEKSYLDGHLSVCYVGVSFKIVLLYLEGHLIFGCLMGVLQDSFYLSWRTPKSEVSMKIGVKYLERHGGVHQDTKGNRFI